MDREMGKANKSGWMDHDTRANGRTEKLMVMESFTTQMVTFMKETGLTTRLTETEHTHMQMERSTLVSGKTISNMASDWRPGLMVQSTKAHTTKGRRMEKVN